MDTPAATRLVLAHQHSEVKVVKARQTVRLACVVALGMLLATMAHAEWKFSGYTQVRLNVWDGAYGDTKPGDDFLVRRARVKLEGTVDPDTMIALQADLANLVSDESTSGSGNIELKDALITRKLTPERSVTVGYTSVPFGYEVPTSDATQLPLERSQCASKFFPGERDTGVYFHYRPTEQNRPQFDLGYGNGLHKWYDVAGGNRDSGSRALLGRVQWRLGDAGLAGLSYMWADRDRGPAAGATTSFSSEDVLGLHARYAFNSKWLTQAEYYHGSYLKDGTSTVASVDADGWYGLAAYTFSPRPVTAFYRYDTLDSGDSNDYQRHTLGVVFDQTKTQRFTLQCEDIRNDGKGGSFDNFAVQWQVKY